MYDHDLEEVESLGWEEFILRQWESIFTGYRSWVGLRTMGRRWSDLIEVGLGCSQDIADQLVRTEIIDRQDRDLEGATEAQAVVFGMADVLTDMRDLGPELSASLLERHALFLEFIRACVLGADDGEAAEL